MNCPKCGSATRMQVQAVISAPGEMYHRLSKRNLRSKDVYLMGVLWETADFICTNVECQYIHTRYGNYVTRLEKENKHLLAVAEAAQRLVDQQVGIGDQAMQALIDALIKEKQP